VGERKRDKENRMVKWWWKKVESVNREAPNREMREAGGRIGMGRNTLNRKKQNKRGVWIPSERCKTSMFSDRGGLVVEERRVEEDMKEREERRKERSRKR